MLRGIAEAWRKFQSGRFWQNFKLAIGCVGYVRRAEITFGKTHGWHPHLHVQIHATRDAEPWIAALAVRWRTIVRRVLGDRHAPTLERGLDLRLHDRAGDYIGESALELSDADAKRARGAGRLSIAQLADLVARGVRDDASASVQARHARLVTAWGEYVAASRGRRALTWSVGLRREAGLVEDEAEADAEADAAEAERSPVLAVMPGAEWSRTRRSAIAICALLEAAERGDVTALVRAGCDPPEGWQDPAEAWPRETRAG